MCVRSYLQLVLVKDAQQVVWNDPVESLEEAVDLLAHVVAQPLLRQGIQILVLGGVRDSRFGPVRDEFDGFDELSAVVVDLLDEVQFQVVAGVQVGVLNVLDLGQVQVGIVLLEVLVVHPKADQLGEEGSGEPRPDQLPVGSTEGTLVQALADDLTGKLKVLQLEMGRPVRVRMDERLSFVVECTEQATARIEQGTADQLEPLAPQTTPIDT